MRNHNLLQLSESILILHSLYWSSSSLLSHILKVHPANRFSSSNCMNSFSIPLYDKIHLLFIQQCPASPSWSYISSITWLNPIWKSLHNLSLSSSWETQSWKPSSQFIIKKTQYHPLHACGDWNLFNLCICNLIPTMKLSCLILMWDGGDFRVCGGDFGGVEEEQESGDWIWSQIATRILASPLGSILSMGSKQNNTNFHRKTKF